MKEVGRWPWEKAYHLTVGVHQVEEKLMQAGTLRRVTDINVDIVTEPGITVNIQCHGTQVITSYSGVLTHEQ